MGKVSTPEIVRLNEQPYICVRVFAALPDVQAVIANTLGVLAGRLSGWQEAAIGMGVVRYRRMSEAGIAMDIGYTTDRAVAETDAYASDVLPAGQYASIAHLGPYDELGQAHAHLQTWSRHLGEMGLAFDRSETTEGQSWNALIELYHTPPEGESDPQKWLAQIFARLQD